jgi:hypothetical protein
MPKWRKQQSVAGPSRTQSWAADDTSNLDRFAGSIARGRLSGDLVCLAFATGGASTVHAIGASSIGSDVAAITIVGAAACTVASKERVTGTLP